MLIHIKRNAEVFGPYSIEEARDYLSSDRLSLSDFAQLPGTTEWIPLGSVPGVRSAPPPPLPTPPATPPPWPRQEASAPPVPTQPVIAQEPSRPPSVRLGPVLRDVAIIFVLTAMGGVIARFVPREDPAETPIMAIAVSNFLLGTVGFIISGCLATGNRWRHLAYVALGAWLASIINVLFFGFPIQQWMLSAFFMALIMGVGGGLSFIFKRSTAA